MNGRVRLSLTVQVLLLVLVTIVAAQAVTIAAVFLVPPSRPPSFTALQVASALRGDTVEPSDGRSLERRLVKVLPKDFESAPPGAGRIQVERLAALLAAPPGDIRFHHRPASALSMLSLGRRPFTPPQRGPGPGPFQPGAFEGGFTPEAVGPGEFVLRDVLVSREDGGEPLRGRRGRHPPPPGAMLRRLNAGGYAATLGEFTAAWKQPDGSWIVVQPSPDLGWLQRMTIWVGGGLIVMGPVALWFARRITAPLRRFAASADALGRDPQAEAIEVRGPAEIGMAARAINAMQTRMSRYVRDRVGMMGAISHDLRTPLTRIRFKIEKTDPPVRAAVLSDVEQMEQMIASVLAFIRDTHAPAPREPLDLASLVACAVDDAAVTGADVKMTLDEPLIVEADAVALQRLFDNLIDNAVKYGHRARVSVRRAAEEALVTVEDDGPGLAATEFEKVFAPFYRTPEAKAGANGIGLGLAVARSVARAHGGDIVLQRGRIGGLVAQVSLPLAAA